MLGRRAAVNLTPTYAANGVGCSRELLGGGACPMRRIGLPRGPPTDGVSVCALERRWQPLTTLSLHFGPGSDSNNATSPAAHTTQ